MTWEGIGSYWLGSAKSGVAVTHPATILRSRRNVSTAALAGRAAGKREKHHEATNLSSLRGIVEAPVFAGVPPLQELVATNSKRLLRLVIEEFLALTGCRDVHPMNSRATHMAPLLPVDLPASLRSNHLRFPFPVSVFLLTGRYVYGLR